jgi:hypothetical protein
MKNTIRLKSLLSISFLIFALPFLQTCSDDALKSSLKRAVPTQELEDSKIVYNKETNSNATKRDSIVLNKSEKEKVIQTENNDAEIWLKEAKRENTFNLYSLAYKAFADFDFKDFTDKSFYIFLIFPVLILLTITMLIMSFRKRFKQIMILSILNVVLLLIATLSLYSISVIEDFNQIKYGYYLFVLNSILIIIESRKQLHRSIEQQ